MDFYFAKIVHPCTFLLPLLTYMTMYDDKDNDDHDNNDSDNEHDLLTGLHEKIPNSFRSLRTIVTFLSKTCYFLQLPFVSAAAINLVKIIL